MQETIAERHFRDRMQSIEHLVHLPEAKREALSGQDYRDLIALCGELSRVGSALLAQEYRRLFKNRLTVAWLTTRRVEIEALCENYIRLAEIVREFIVRTWQNGNGAPLQQLDDAIRAMTEAKQNLLERWPVGSPEEMAEARAAIARGETEDAEAAFADIAGTDVATWRQRVEEYKQSGKWSSKE